MNKLNYYRKKIDAIDRNIVKLMLSRFKIAKLIAFYKKNHKLRIPDKKRELQVIDNIKSYSDKKNQKFITIIFKNIIKYSKKLQK